MVEFKTFLSTFQSYKLIGHIQMKFVIIENKCDLGRISYFQNK
jgi:hypothetical protein